jgi:hypothetical protein
MVWFLQEWTDIAVVVVTQGHVFVLYQLLFVAELSENLCFDLLRYRSRVSCSFVVNREIIWIVVICFYEGKNLAFQCPIPL